MLIYNTQTRRKEEFVPIEEGKVRIYACGPTVYNFFHIGNARPFVTWDVIKRYFRKRGFEVKHIQNFTDMDDKIIKAANTEGVSWQVITDRYIKHPSEVLSVGDVVTVKVLGVDLKKKRISLTMKGIK